MAKPPPKRFVEGKGFWTLGERLGRRGSIPVTKVFMGVFILLGGIVEEFTLTLDHG